MILEELPDNSYFVFRGKPRTAYKKIGRVSDNTAYSIKAEGCSTSLSDLGFCIYYWDSNDVIIEINKEEARNIYLSTIEKAVNKYEKCLGSLNKLKKQIKNEI